MVRENKLEEEQDPRAKREHETREVQARTETWAPSSLLPVPDPQDGYTFRWIRTGMYGEQDNTNVSRKFREGWEPVRLEDHPELKLLSDIDTRFAGAAVVGGLMLCKNSIEKMNARKEYMAKLNSDQMEAVDQNFMREQDARMPLLPPERRTRVTFGDGS